MGRLIDLDELKPRPVITRKNQKYPEKLNRMPHTIETQNLLADELIEWALLEDSLLLEKFPLSKMISPYRFFKFAKTESNLYFTDAFDFARACCAVRMQQGKHGLDMGLVHKIFPLYHRQYDEYLIERENRAAEIKKITDSREDVNFVINMTPSKSDIKPFDVINIEKQKKNK